MRQLAMQLEQVQAALMDEQAEHGRLQAQLEDERALLEEERLARKALEASLAEADRELLHERQINADLRRRMAGEQRGRPRGAGGSVKRGPGRPLGSVSRGRGGARADGVGGGASDDDLDDLDYGAAPVVKKPAGGGPGRKGSGKAPRWSDELSAEAVAMGNGQLLTFSEFLLERANVTPAEAAERLSEWSTATSDTIGMNRKGMSAERIRFVSDLHDSAVALARAIDWLQLQLVTTAETRSQLHSHLMMVQEGVGQMPGILRNMYLQLGVYAGMQIGQVFFLKKKEKKKKKKKENITENWRAHRSFFPHFFCFFFSFSFLVSRHSLRDGRCRVAGATSATIASCALLSSCARAGPPFSGLACRPLRLTTTAKDLWFVAGRAEDKKTKKKNWEESVSPSYVPLHFKN